MIRLWHTPHLRLLATLAVILSVWTLSSLGYFFFLPVLDAEIGYNDAPVFYAVYYALWLAVVIAVFRKGFLTWSDRYQPEQSRVLPILVAVVYGSFALVILPQLPAIDAGAPPDVTDLAWATPAYFLPKTIEIMFQQVLLIELVLALAAMGLTLAQLGLLTAALFGGFHLSLAMNGYDWFYVIRYSIAATAFGAVVPVLLLRVRSGFVLTFALHWGWYALDTIVVHLAFQ
jgi:hypothetical protein